MVDPWKRSGSGMTMADGPPDYADPIVLRLRFVPHRREPFFPTHVASKAAWDGYVTDAQMWEGLRIAGHGLEPPQQASPSGPAEPAQAGWTPAAVLPKDAQPRVIPAQELLLTPREPLLLTEPPKEYMERIPRLSGKEGAKDTPSWARGKPRKLVRRHLSTQGV